jgi:hypothetical protein
MGTSAEPVTPASNEQSGAAGVTFEDMERQLKEQEAALLKPDLTKVTLEGDDVPEALRGKTAAEALARVKLLEETLKTSEIARQQALATASLAAERREPAPAPKPEPAPEPQITAADVAAAFNEDPEKGIQLMAKMQEQGIKRATEQFTQRMEPMLAGSVSTAEADARRRYADEFEIYADEIKATLAQIPNRQVMSSPASWDDLIAYVRGKDPMKLFTRMQEKERATQQQQAQQEQRNLTGYSSTGGQRPAAPAATGVVIDETVKEVCRNLGISEADYIKWAKVS